MSFERPATDGQTQEKAEVFPIGDTADFARFMDRVHEVQKEETETRALAAALESRGSARGGIEPAFLQDGGYEIHPKLKGITFQFWTGAKAEEGVAVTFTGNAPEASWADHLTGKVFRNFAEAKQWLRQESKKYGGE